MPCNPRRSQLYVYIKRFIALRPSLKCWPWARETSSKHIMCCDCYRTSPSLSRSVPGAAPAPLSPTCTFAGVGPSPRTLPVRRNACVLWNCKALAILARRCDTYRSYYIEPPAHADDSLSPLGLLLSGILSDTLGLRSPTTSKVCHVYTAATRPACRRCILVLLNVAAVNDKLLADTGGMFTIIILGNPCVAV